MAKKREKIVVAKCQEWWWRCRMRGMWEIESHNIVRKHDAIRSARRFAKRFIEPPEVVIED